MAPNDLTLHLCPEAGFEGVRHYTELVCCQRTNRVLETDHLKVGPFFVFDGSSWAGFPMIEHKATTVISAPHLSLPLFSLPSHAPPHTQTCSRTQAYARTLCSFQNFANKYVHLMSSLSSCALLHTPKGCDWRKF